MSVSHAQLPSEVRGKSLRACIKCKLIKTVDQFKAIGCDNCNASGKGYDFDRINEETTTYYDGFQCLMKPTESWVAKWQRQVKLLPGMYALNISTLYEDE